MNGVAENIRALLGDCGYDIGFLPNANREVITFENNTVLGFIINYEQPGELLEKWSDDSKNVLENAQFALRRSDEKAWNVYFVFLALEQASYSESILMAALEENLVGTRKIARASARDLEELRLALLPLLPIQNNPRLDAVDILDEIRLRTSEIPKQAIDALLMGAHDGAVLTLLEEGQ